MANRNKLIRYGVTFGALLLIAGLCAGCDDGFSTSDQVPQQPVAAPSGPHLSETLVSRNPDKNNGETLRILRKDDNDAVREIQVNYSDGRTGLIVKEASGKIVSLKMVLMDKSVMTGNIDATGKTIASGQQVGKNGKMRVNFDPQKIEAYLADGTTLRFTLNRSGSLQNWKFFQADGVTPSAEQQDDGTSRIWLKLYDANGKLVYDEKRNAPEPNGMTQSYTGMAYDATGVATHRVTLTEGPYDNGGGYVVTLDTLNADGTVKSTATLARWSEPAHQIGSYPGQDDLISARRTMASQVNDAKGAPAQIVTQLSGLLID
jgi:hypothetical protein